MATKVSDRPDIEEQYRDAEDALGMGTGKAARPVSLGDGIEGAISRAEDAGYKVLWDSQTGEMSFVNLNMVRQVLRLTREDGSYVYTSQRPDITPERGTLLCLLCPDHPEREARMAMGFKTNETCRKTNIRTETDVEYHMRARHKRAWNMLERVQARVKEDEDRRFQRLMLERLTTAAAPVSSAGAAVQTVSETCADCGEEITAKPKGMHFARLNHRKRQHGG
jgi:hypothetical protein